MQQDTKTKENFISNPGSNNQKPREIHPPAAYLGETGQLTLNKAAYEILKSFGVQKVFLSYFVKGNEKHLRLADVGPEHVEPYKLQRGVGCYFQAKRLKSNIGELAWEFWVGKYSVSLHVADESDTETVKSAVILELVKIQ